MDARARKIFRDLFQERARALLVLLALIVGGWAMASVIASTTVLRREVRDNFVITNPMHAKITFRGEGDVVAAAEAAPWVTEAEGRTSVAARARGGFDGRLPVVLMLVDDFENQKIATVELEQGRWPGPGEIVLERDDLTVLGSSEPPDVMQLQLPGAEWMDIPVSGVVHDPGQAPARMEHRLYIYAPRETARALGADLSEQDLIVTMAEPAVGSWDLARGHARLLGTKLEEQGFEVLHVHVPKPGQHPHAGQMSTMFFVQLVFGGLAMLLSGAVVVNMISSLMQRHVAQIGVLKTIGCTPAQVGASYMLMIFVLSIAALAVTIPTGFLGGLRYGEYVTGALNFDILSPGVPLYGWLLFIGASLLLPQLAAAIPVLRGIRVTVREALRSGSGGAGGAREFIAAAPGVPIALRNVARRPLRSALTTLSLAVGLAALGSAFHVGASMRRTMEVVTENCPYDVAMAFDTPVDEESVFGTLSEFDHLLSSWKGAAGGTAKRVGDDGSVGDPFPVLVADPLERPSSPVIDGEWRLPPEGRAIVVTTRFASIEGVGVGDVMTLRIDGVDSRWPVGGIVRTIGGNTGYLLSDEPLGFTGIRGVSAKLKPPSPEALERASGAPVVLRHGGGRAPALTTALAKYQATVADQVEEALEQAGIPVRMGTTRAETVAGLEDHIYVMTWQVALASLVILAVGGLGLASAMSVNVLERTREIGVLRSLGATPTKLAAIFASEGAVIGTLSLVLGMAASYPLGRAISDFFGNMMFKSPLDVGTSFKGAAWGAGVTLVIVIVVTLVALAQTLRQSTTAALRHE